VRFRRKVQIVGGSTYIISLPKEWVERVNLRQGSELLVEVMPDLSLKILSEDVLSKAGDEVSEYRIDFMPGNTEFFIAKVIASYVTGYDKIVIKYPNITSKELSEVMDLISKKTIGLEVVEEGQDYIALQCLASLSTLSLREVLRKIISLSEDSFKDIENYFITGNAVLLDRVVERDDLIDKLYLYGLRQLNHVLLGKTTLAEIGLNNPAEILYLVFILKTLERIADHLFNIAKQLKEIQAVGKIIQLENLIKELKRNYSFITNYILIKFKAESLDELGKLLTKLKAIEAAPYVGDFPHSEYVSLRESVKRISAYLRDLIEIILDNYALKDLISSTSRQ